MNCSIEFAAKKIILEHYLRLRKPVGEIELEALVQQAVGSGYSSVEFSSVLKQLKDGGAIFEDQVNCFTPNYEEVEV